MVRRRDGALRDRWAAAELHGPWADHHPAAVSPHELLPSNEWPASQPPVHPADLPAVGHVRGVEPAILCRAWALHLPWECWAAHSFQFRQLRAGAVDDLPNVHWRSVEVTSRSRIRCEAAHARARP